MVSHENFQYDLIVIGSGPAGHHGAIQAAKLGHRVAIVEREKCVGGVCFNTGTVPSKTLREAVLFLSGFRQRGLYGYSYRVKSDLTIQDLLYRCERVVNQEVDVYRAQFGRNGVDVLQGRAELTGPNSVRVTGPDGIHEFSTRYVLLAVGTVPAQSADFPVDGERIIDADGVFSLRKVPRTMIVVGAGVIGLEYASMFATLGVHVTVMEKRSTFLEFLDGEIVEALKYHMRDMGVVFRLGEEVERVERDGDEVVAHTKSNKLLRAETVLYAVGRQGSTRDLNLGAAGLEADSRGRLTVDEDYRTAVPTVFAAGDVIGFPSLASTSMEQGRIAAARAFGVADAVVAKQVPYGIYTIPEISFVGKTEEELTSESVPYECGMAHYREIARGNIIGDTTGRLKLIFHRETEQLLGVHIIGEGATELVHIGQAVLALEGSVRYFVDQVFNYPTLAECYKVAALHGLNKLAWRSTRAA